MPIPFREDDQIDELGAAAYLLIEPTRSGEALLGAVFSINARGEPLEFVYSRVELPRSPLWRPDALRRHAERVLVASLLRLCSTSPGLLLYEGNSVNRSVLRDDLSLPLPVGRVADPSDSTVGGEDESVSCSESTQSNRLFWTLPIADHGPEARALFHHITGAGLLSEPFDRARAGLSEVYPDDLGGELAGD